MMIQARRKRQMSAALILAWAALGILVIAKKNSSIEKLSAGRRLRIPSQMNLLASPVKN